MKRFDFNRAKEFKNELTKYLQTLLNNQEQVANILFNTIINGYWVEDSSGNLFCHEFLKILLW